MSVWISIVDRPSTSYEQSFKSVFLNKLSKMDKIKRRIIFFVGAAFSISILNN